MTPRFASIAAVAAVSALFAGNAMAQMPASGEGPLFLDEAKGVSTLTRAEVQAQAVATPPAAGSFDGHSSFAQGSSVLTRAEVRAQAIAHPPAAGGFDGGTVAQQRNLGAPTQATGE